MDGYEIITSDEHKVGHVIGVEDDLLIAESGLVRKKQHAIPSTFAHVDDSESVVRVSVSKELISDSPEVEHGNVDRRAVAEYYGLAEGLASG